MYCILFVRSHVLGLLLIFSLYKVYQSAATSAGDAGRERQLFNSPSVPPKPTSQAHFRCRPHPGASLPPLYPSPHRSSSSNFSSLHPLLYPSPYCSRHTLGSCRSLQPAGRLTADLPFPLLPLLQGSTAAL